ERLVEAALVYQVQLGAQPQIFTTLAVVIERGGEQIGERALDNVVAGGMHVERKQVRMEHEHAGELLELERRQLHRCSPGESVRVSGRDAAAGQKRSDRVRVGLAAELGRELLDADREQLGEPAADVVGHLHRQTSTASAFN